MGKSNVAAETAVGMTSANNEPLAITSLTKVFPNGTVANDGISLTMNPGEVFGLLGPNGAGKTTLVNQLLGLLVPTAGGISMAGIDLVKKPATARKLCSYLPQGTLPINTMRMRTAVELIGRIRGGERSAVRARTEELIEVLELGEWQNKPGQVVSGGIKRLYGFLMAAVVPGKVVILDEPTNDVDPLRRRLLWREVRNLARMGSIVLLITHNVLEGERSVDRLAILHHGKVLAEGTPGSLKALDAGRLRLELVLEPGRDEPQAPDWAKKIAATGRRVHWSIDESTATQALEWARTLTEQKTAESYELGPATLENHYLRLIGRDDINGLEEER